jgi:pimeloyl-ACP methyl ester carboxylesterase
VDSFRRDGLTFDVRDAGPPDGEPVVLLHGFPQDSSAWAEVAPVLNKAGLRTLAPDQRGCSPMARPRGRGRYTLRETTADVLALLDAAGLESAHIVGHDWGGMVAWALAAWHPERVRTLTALSVPHPAAMAKAMVTSSQGLRSYYMFAFQLPVLPERLLLSRGGNPLRRMLRGGGLSREAATHYVTRMREPGALSAALGWYRSLPAAAGFRTGRITVPTAFVWGRRDPFVARASAEGTDRYVTGPYVAHPLDAGHWLPETRPAEVADAVLEVALP